MAIDDMPKVGQGVAKPASLEDIERDNNGFTNPNLHRRIESPGTSNLDEGILDRKYSLGIYGNDSYRTTEIVTHDENSTTSEIP